RRHARRDRVVERDAATFFLAVGWPELGGARCAGAREWRDGGAREAGDGTLADDHRGSGGSRVRRRSDGAGTDRGQARRPGPADRDRRRTVRFSEQQGGAMNEVVLRDIDGGVALLTLNRPERLNAW